MLIRTVVTAAVIATGTPDYANTPMRAYKIEQVHASEFSVASNGGTHVACPGHSLRDDALIFAHKRGRCGSVARITYKGRMVYAVLIDRGPYISGREIDLGKATARALGFPGLGQVTIEWLEKVKHE